MAPAPLIADLLDTGDAPGLARVDVEADTGLDLDLDLGTDETPDAADDDGALDLEDLDLGELGTLELGGVESAAPAPAAVEELAPLELGDAAAPAAAAGAEEQADLDLLAGSDEVETRLELARAFIDMGDVDGARDILKEVMSEGSSAQREEAARMLDALRPA
ncbi:MAG: FimV/HubP family polar landmark protein [Planctomycetota bacterium]